jgi:hypothetical protein
MISTNSTADFMRGGATHFDALDVAVELASFDDNAIFTLQSFASEIGLDEKAASAALWCLKESGHIDLQIAGPQFSARRFLTTGGSDGRDI